MALINSNVMDFNMKKFVKDAGSAISRVVQVSIKFEFNQQIKKIAIKN